ncbi:MAG: hypothetical protein RLZZ609_741 [Cyanobacteriota bacterium]|jgi:hypothetical protein
MLRASKSNTLTLQRSIVLRQLGIVQEALRVALVKEPCLRQTWPQLDFWPAACARNAGLPASGGLGGSAGVWG